MALIKNFNELAKTPQRKSVLQIVESGFESLQPSAYLSHNVSVSGHILHVQNHSYDLNEYNRVFVLGIGKGSAEVVQYLEKNLKTKLTAGFDIDVRKTRFQKTKFSLGTHPLPSEQNLDFTKDAVQALSGLHEVDLVLFVICGGGSAMLTLPHSISISDLTKVNQALLRSGAEISEMNIIRKHLSSVQGGGLAKILFPAKVVSLVCSDVPGNDLSTIASGPVTKENASISDALKILQKYELDENFEIKKHLFETPKEEKYFSNVSQYIILSNRTALAAMTHKAHRLGFRSEVVRDNFQADANSAGEELLSKSKPGYVTFFAGETHLKVHGTGQGGRNQHLVLNVLKKLDDKTVVVSFDSDGWDNSPFAGAVGDLLTVMNAHHKGLDISDFSNNNDSFNFFRRIGDGITTGRLPTNVSDLMVVFRAI